MNYSRYSIKKRPTFTSLSAGLCKCSIEELEI
nr:MAG TPA: hypothetical protein [Inoviridae sp.]